jgi:hypothetical protein
MSGCDAGGAEITEADKERVVAELQGRSFRQFDPHVDGDPRKGVILDFYEGISLGPVCQRGSCGERVADLRREL